MKRKGKTDEAGGTVRPAKAKLYFCTLMGLTVVLSCLTLLPTLRLSLPEDTPRSATSESRDNTTCAASMVPLSLLHSNVARLLVEGALPLDPRDNQSWSVFKKESPEYPCSQYKTRFGINMPRVWLVSFPRSGNTWTRYLLEAASGIFTGSVYGDTILYKTGYLGESDPHDSQRTLVQKTHLHSLYMINKVDSLFMRFVWSDKYVPTVLLLRNPAKAVLSYYKFYKNRPHPSRIPASEYEGEAFRTFVNDGVRRWTELALDRLLWTEAPLYVMHYERLAEDPIKELTALLAFLGVPRHEGRLACLALQLEGTFKSEESEPLDPYTFEEKAMMVGGALAVNRTLQLLGYAPLPTYAHWPMRRPPPNTIETMPPASKGAL